LEQRPRQEHGEAHLKNLGGRAGHRSGGWTTSGTPSSMGPRISRARGPSPSASPFCGTSTSSWGFQAACPGWPGPAGSPWRRAAASSRPSANFSPAGSAAPTAPTSPTDAGTTRRRPSKELSPARAPQGNGAPTRAPPPGRAPCRRRAELSPSRPAASLSPSCV
jgi:hypothetical protein